MVLKVKRKLFKTMICLGLALGVSGCAATSRSGNEGANEVKKLEASSWSLVAEKEFDFPSYIIGYYNKDSALSVGYGGQIYYMNSEAQDWPMAANTSMCRFGLDMVEGTEGTVCYTCGNAGDVTKSTDGGKTFVKKANFGSMEPNQCKLLSFIDENIGLIASSKRLAITKDGAETWAEITTAPEKISALRMESADKFYFIGEDLNFYKTTDGGVTWESTPLNLPLGEEYLTKIQNLAFSVDGENTYTVFCVEKETKLLKSYSTSDGWATCIENTVAEFKEPNAVLYLNHDGTVLTNTSVINKKATVFEKQS